MLDPTGWWGTLPHPEGPVPELPGEPIALGRMPSSGVYPIITAVVHVPLFLDGEAANPNT